MAIWTDDFSTGTVGQEPVGWDRHTVPGVTDGIAKFEVEEGAYFYGGKVARFDTNDNEDFVVWNTVSNQHPDMEVLYLVKLEDPEGSAVSLVNSFYLRASVDGSDRVGYRFYWSLNFAYIARVEPGPNGATTLGSATHSAAGQVYGQWVWVRGRANGSSLKLKAWKRTDSEPLTWDVEVTDSTYTSSGLFLYSPEAYSEYGEECIVDYFAAGSEGDSPQVPPVGVGDLRINQAYLEVALGPTISGNLDASDVIAEWPFSEGSGSTVADVSGNGNHLTLTSPDLWINDADGTSVRFTPKAHTDRAYLTDLSNNGTIGASLDNSSEWTFVLVTKNLDSDSDRFLAGIEFTTGGAPELQFRQSDFADNKFESVAMVRQGDGSELLPLSGNEFDSDFTVHIQTIDTRRGVNPERHKYYKNGTLVTSFWGSAPTTVVNSQLDLLDPSAQTFAFGSSPDGTSSSQANIHYALLLNRQIGDDEARDLWTRLRANSDGSIFADPNPPEVLSQPAEVAVTDTSITVGTTATSTDPIVHTFGLWDPNARPEVGDDNRLTSVLTGSGALFFVSNVPGTSGVQATYQFTGLDPDTTYVAYAATTNTLTGESYRYSTATWITTTPVTPDVVFLNLPVTDSFSEAITNPVLTATGETTASLVIDVDPAFVGGDIYVLVSPDDEANPYTLEDQALFEAQTPVTAVSGTNTIPLTGLNAGSEYAVGVLVTASGAVSNIVNLTVVTDSPPATAPIEATPLEEVIVESGSTGVINLGTSLVAGSEPITVSYAGLPANYTYTSDGTITLGAAIPGEYTVTRTVSNGTLPNLVTEFSLLVVQGFQVVEGSAGTGLTAPPYVVAVDADIMVYLVGIPNRVVVWGLTGSAGTLTVFNQVTDKFGRAAALFSPAPGEEGMTATVTAEYGD